MTETSQRADDLTLYYHDLCPFCVRVRQVVSGLSLALNLKDVRQDPSNRDELIEGGGRSMVPCLRIDYEDGTATWLYESSDISAYLQERFGTQRARQA